MSVSSNKLLVLSNSLRSIQLVFIHFLIQPHNHLITCTQTHTHEPKTFILTAIGLASEMIDHIRYNAGDREISLISPSQLGVH